MELSNNDMVKEMDKINKPTKLVKKKKIPKKVSDSPNDSDLLSSIANKDKMVDSPKSDFKPIKKKSNKKKSGYNSTSSVSSIGSSIGSDSSRSSKSSRSASSRSSKSSKSSGSSGSSNSFGEREKFSKKKRKEEIRQEKFVMLTRISNLSKKGITTRKKFNMNDDIDDIRFECYRMTREKNSQKAVKSMQQMLISAATFIEFGNMMFDPFNLKLNGFSKNMLLTVSDYDDSLEEIHHKWSGKTAVGPEMMVLFSFITSAIFHHAGNTTTSSATKSSSSSSSSGSSFMNLFSSMMPGKPKAASEKPVETPVKKESENESKPEESKKRKTMKGPSASPFAGLVSNMKI